MTTRMIGTDGGTSIGQTSGACTDWIAQELGQPQVQYLKFVEAIDPDPQKRHNRQYSQKGFNSVDNPQALVVQFGIVIVII